MEVKSESLNARSEAFTGTRSACFQRLPVVGGSLLGWERICSSRRLAVKKRARFESESNPRYGSEHALGFELERASERAMKRLLHGALASARRRPAARSRQKLAAPCPGASHEHSPEPRASHDFQAFWDSKPVNDNRSDITKTHQRLRFLWRSTPISSLSLRKVAPINACEFPLEPTPRFPITKRVPKQGSCVTKRLSDKEWNLDLNPR